MNWTKDVAVNQFANVVGLSSTRRKHGLTVFVVLESKYQVTD